MEQKLIGYKLVKPEYTEAARVLVCGGWWDKFANNNLETKGYTFASSKNEGDVADLFKKAGVLDLWFEPVYKQQFKVGDWVCETWDASPDKTKAYQITDIVKDNVYYTRPDSTVALLNQLRLATKEEIEAVNLKLPTIDGIVGKDENGFIKYGNDCHIASKNSLTVICENILSFNAPDPNLEGYYGTNFGIKAITLTSGRTVSIEQITQFHNYLKANP